MTQEQQDVWVGYAVSIISVIVVLLLVWVAGMIFAHAHEYASDKQTRDYFEGLMQPDNPAVSCCGEADAYWADDFEQSVDGYYIAIITDGRDDKLPPTPEYPEGRERVHRPPGTRILVPNSKIKWDKTNPTGHGIIFMPSYDYIVDPETDERSPAIPYCYCPPQGA
jgi:hypothetical protein